jgi:hypothetical protein
MVEILKSLVYVEIGNGSVLVNVKWILVIALTLLQMYIVRRAIKSFFTCK